VIGAENERALSNSAQDSEKEGTTFFFLPILFDLDLYSALSTHLIKGAEFIVSNLDAIKHITVYLTSYP
jgi:hypothetical protein